MGMSDIYHIAEWFVRGSVGGDDLVQRIKAKWAQEIKDNPRGPAARLMLEHVQLERTIISSFTIERLGGPVDAVVEFWNYAPRDDEARACWGLLAGDVVDALLDLPSIDAWVLQSDEGHEVGRWRAP